MVSRFSILTNLLLVSTALAVQPSRLGARLARHHENRQSKFSSDIELRDADYMTTNSTTWAGAVWVDSFANFTTISGTITIPIPEGNAGSSAAAWVGLDALHTSDAPDCTNAILQAGVFFSINSNGDPEYTAWYEWFPDGASFFSEITISAGDTVILSVTAFSANSGEAFIVNLSNGQYVFKAITSDGHPLCPQVEAMWIVEDYTENGNLVPFTNFGSVTFSNAFASNPDHILFDPSGANLWDIEQNGKMLTQTSANGSSVTIKYIG